MNELIEENLLLKLTLLLMIRQFYNYKITHEEANEYNVQYDEEDISDELLKAHLGESKDMKKEDLSDRDIKELDEYTDNEIKKMYDEYCSENSECKSFEEWQKENVDSALINELEYEFFSNRNDTIEEKYPAKT